MFFEGGVLDQHGTPTKFCLPSIGQICRNCPNFDCGVSSTSAESALFRSPADEAVGQFLSPAFVPRGFRRSVVAGSAFFVFISKGVAQVLSEHGVHPFCTQNATGIARRTRPCTLFAPGLQPREMVVHPFCNQNATESTTVAGQRRAEKTQTAAQIPVVEHKGFVALDVVLEDLSCCRQVGSRGRQIRVGVAHVSDCKYFPIFCPEMPFPIPYL
jgi:hypothetical protein